MGLSFEHEWVVCIYASPVSTGTQDIPEDISAPHQLSPPCRHQATKRQASQRMAGPEIVQADRAGTRLIPFEPLRAELSPLHLLIPCPCRLMSGPCCSLKPARPTSSLVHVWLYKHIRPEQGRVSPCWALLDRRASALGRWVSDQADGLDRDGKSARDWSCSIVATSWISRGHGSCSMWRPGYDEHRNIQRCSHTRQDTEGQAVSSGQREAVGCSPDPLTQA